MITLTANKVLVPTDFSPHAEKALRWVLDQEDDPADVTVLHVGAPKSGYIPADPAIVWEAVSDDQRRESLEAEFRKWDAEDPRRASVHFETRFGVPDLEIPKYAEEHDVELIVMPSHGRTGFTRLLIGSVAEGVTRHAHCPVLILRE